ncbi:uncharacterized protein LOC110377519 [Helicoverpa armigera]|uniref:uncharacterized protein LOC110377519 n=1 Tax=Helicoverpa armigera TaxID=29058 RepID=UPI003082B2E7
MFVMHFCSVCKMNKIGGVLVVYILVVAATGAADLKATSQSGAASKAEQTSKSKEPVTASKASRVHHVSASASVSNGMGVASIAGVESRNGRVSSISGVKFYPSADSMVKTDSKGNYYFKSSENKMQMPLTITKQGDGVSGTIRIMPGSVSVSSSANSGSASASAGPKITGFDPWSTSFMKPMMNDLFFPDPFPAFPSIANTAYNTKMYEPKFQRIPEPKFQKFPEPKFQRFPEPKFERIPEPSFPKTPQPSFSMMPQSSFTPRSQDPWGKDMFKHALPQYDIMGPAWYYPTFNPYFNFW